VRNGGTLHKKSGRPLLIDVEGLQNMAAHVARHPEYKNKDINILIDLKHENTYRKRHMVGKDEEINIPATSMKSVGRYVKKVLVILNDEELYCLDEEGQQELGEEDMVDS